MDTDCNDYSRYTAWEMHVKNRREQGFYHIGGVIPLIHAGRVTVKVSFC